jgi:transmembrane sensor
MGQLSKYIDNKNFIHWVFESTPELEAWWKQFETDHPEEKRNIQQVRRVLLKLRTTNQNLSAEEKILMFSRILRQVEEKQQSGKTRRLITGLLKYAAVALMFFSFGALLFYKPSQFNPQLYSQKLAEPIPENSAKLIRANGEDILLKQDKSIIKYEADGKLVVNNDTISTDVSRSAQEMTMNQLTFVTRWHKSLSERRQQARLSREFHG